MSKNDVSDIIKSYREGKEKKGQSMKLKRINSEIVEDNDRIEDFKAYDDGEEHYVFKRGKKFECEFICNEKPKKGTLVFFNDEEKKMIIYSKKIKKNDKNYKLVFEADSLILPESPYTLSLYFNGRKVISDLKIDLRKGENKFGQHIVLEDPMEECDFPSGRFYIFGKTEDIMKKFEEGKTCVTVFTEESGIDIDSIKDRYEKGKIVDNLEQD